MHPVPLRRRSVWHLVAAWFVYWTALVLVVVGGPALRVWHLTHDPARHGGVTLRIANDLVTALVVEGSATVWSASARLLTIALWIAGPPLVLFLVWLRRRPPGTVAALPAAGRPPVGVTAGHAPDPRRAEASLPPAPDVLSR